MAYGLNVFTNFDCAMEIAFDSMNASCSSDTFSWQHSYQLFASSSVRLTLFCSKIIPLPRLGERYATLLVGRSPFLFALSEFFLVIFIMNAPFKVQQEILSPYFSIYLIFYHAFNVLFRLNYVLMQDPFLYPLLPPYCK